MSQLLIKELCEKYGLKQTDLAYRFKIPYRTVQDWYSGRRKPPDYVVGLLVRALESDERIEDLLNIISKLKSEQRHSDEDIEEC